MVNNYKTLGLETLVVLKGYDNTMFRVVGILIRADGLRYEIESMRALEFTAMTVTHNVIALASQELKNEYQAYLESQM